MAWIEKLFARMTALYGNKFADMWPDTDLQAIKALWADELGKLSTQEIADGVAKLTQQEWPPTLPQFIGLCRAKVDPLCAYYEAVNGVRARDKGEAGEWSHPAIFWASVDVSAFDLKTLSYSQINARWSSALDAQLKKGSWQPVPNPLVALSYEKKIMSDEDLKKRLEEMNASGIFSEKGNARDWAKRVLADPDRFPAISVKFAREALGI